MKTLCVADLFQGGLPVVVDLPCWIRSRRHHGRICFLDLADATGHLNAVADKTTFPDEAWEKILSIPTESSVMVSGHMARHARGAPELQLSKVELIAPPALHVSPPPRSTGGLFTDRLDKQVSRYRHIYLRNPRFAAVLRAKHLLRKAFRDELDATSFVELDLPILTTATLYEPESAFSLDFFGRPVHLSQCAGLYLAAATQSLERTYTVAPAFRATPSRSPRHNPEFWHIKGQIAFCNLQEMMDWLAETIFRVVHRFIADAADTLEVLGVTLRLAELEPPFPKISYEEAVEILSGQGHSFRLGKSFGPAEERLITKGFSKPLFVTGMPATVEPFPYALDPADPTKTLTADLLAPDGFGEILGVAQFEHDPVRLRSRIASLPLAQQQALAWYVELIEHACVPFSGFGLGLERMLRWLLRLSHVKHTFAFPRLYRRAPYP